MTRLAVIVTLAMGAAAFAPPTAPARASTALSAYVPDGMTAAQWEAVKKKEKAAKAKKNFGVGGARGFKSRSMASWQEAYERGETGHLMPVDPAKVKRGEIALKDVPYMQRGGSWDNEDLVRGGGRFGGKFGGRKGWEKTGFGGITGYNDGKAKKLKANKYDEMFNSGGNFAGGKNMMKMDWKSGYAKVFGVANLEVSPEMSDAQMWQKAGAVKGGIKKAGAKLDAKQMERAQKKGWFGR